MEPDEHELKIQPCHLPAPQTWDRQVNYLIASFSVLFSSLFCFLFILPFPSCCPRSWWPSRFAWAARTVPQADGVAYEQQTLISHSSGGWEAEIWGPAGLGSGEDPLGGRRLMTACCAPTGWEGWGALWGLFLQGPHATHQGSALLTEAPPKGPASLHHSMGSRLPTQAFCGT